MTRRELNLALFEGTADAVLWQPRLETWIGHYQREGGMPARFEGMTNLEIYDELRCSIRYACNRAGIITELDETGIQRTSHRENGRCFETVRTPVGQYTTVYREIWEGEKLRNRRIEGFPIDTVEGLRVITDLVEREQFRVDVDAFQAVADEVGRRAEPTLFFGGSGFTDLIKNHSGLPGTYYLLQDHRDEVEAYLEACDRRDDRKFEAAVQLPCRIWNFGDHATNEFTPPPILTKYLMPRWQRLSEKFRQHGRFTHSHWDGNSKTMLPYLRDTGLDAVESLTPEPQCDMTLEEIKAAVGDKLVCLDLLPAIHFLPEYSLEHCVDFARRVIDLFAPKLVLGISDEISQRGEIEKVEAVSELVDQMCGLAE